MKFSLVDSLLFTSQGSVSGGLKNYDGETPSPSLSLFRSLLSRTAKTGVEVNGK
jgi:hypothetical protein